MRFVCRFSAYQKQKFPTLKSSQVPVNFNEVRIIDETQLWQNNTFAFSFSLSRSCRVQTFIMNVELSLAESNVLLKNENDTNR